MSTPHDVRAIARQFQFRGQAVAFAPHGNGHINDTYLVACQDGAASTRYILQHINRHVFRNPGAVMQNIERVTSHLAAQLAGTRDVARRILTLVPAHNGRAWFVDGEGETWRAYHFIAGARSYETASSLQETIPNFHHTLKRFAALRQAIDADACNRAASARPEIDFALAHEAMAGVLLAANLPQRITHNDTKLNNVLFDDVTGEALCIIDLDTVMPGLALYDFGDLVRTTTSPAAEDERDLTRVTMQFAMFEALVHGYLSEAGDFLTKAEKHFLAFSGKLITFEVGIRFLADYLAGDTYFKIHREGHNLDRCRTQFRLIESIESQETQMNSLVESVAP